MLPSYHLSDRDSFEELQVVVEQLELSQQLLRSRSANKARAAVILIDHVADVLMYRLCMDDFQRIETMEMVIPPEINAKKRNEILFYFDEKVTYLVQKKKLISPENETV